MRYVFCNEAPPLHTRGKVTAQPAGAIAVGVLKTLFVTKTQVPLEMMAEVISGLKVKILCRKNKDF